MKTKCFTLSLLITCFFVIASHCYADNVRIIEGLIESVSDNTIVVRGTDYDITSIPLVNSSGENLSINELQTGKKVNIFFQDGNITSILILEYMLE